MHAAVVVVALLILGCGSKKSSDESGSSPSPSSDTSKAPKGAKEFCDKVFRILHDAEWGKCTDEDKKREKYEQQVMVEHDKKTCIENMQDRVTFNEGAATKCLANLEKLAKEGRQQIYIRRVPECTNVLAGVQAENAPCRGSFECKAGMFCESRGDNPSVCRKVGALGEKACGHMELGFSRFAPEDHTCAPGLKCGDDSTCKKSEEVALGGECDSTKTCAGEHAFCRGGKCGTYSKVGEPCTEPNMCVENLFCEMPADGGDGKCIERMPAGTACSSADRTDDKCRGLCDLGVGKCVSFCGSG